MAGFIKRVLVICYTVLVLNSSIRELYEITKYKKRR